MAAALLAIFGWGAVTVSAEKTMEVLRTGKTEFRRDLLDLFVGIHQLVLCLSQLQLGEVVFEWGAHGAAEAL